MMKMWRISKTQTIGPVYHGTVYNFKPENIRRDKILFFTDKKTFAYDYASQKSFEGQMDADITVIEAFISGNLFDPQDKQDVESVLQYLPTTITVYNDFGMDGHIPIDTWKQLISGEYTEQPYWSSQDLEGKKVGDFLPENDVYGKAMKYRLVEITPDDVYFLDSRFVSDILQGKYTFYWGKEREQNMIKSPQEIISDLKSLNQVDFVKKYSLYNDLHYFPSIYKRSRHPKTTQNNSVWRWLEGDNVFDAIQKAGYNIVKSSEKGNITYAVFPSAEVKIIRGGV